MNEPQKRIKKIGVISGYIAAIFLILGFIGWHYVQSRYYASNSPSFTAPSDWKTYTDPNDLFSLTIPPNWTFSPNGGSILGDMQNSNQLTLLTYQFEGPHADFYAERMQIKISIGPWANDAQHRKMCLERVPHLLNSQPYQVGSLMGNDANGTIDLYTQKAFVIISPYYPGEPGVTISLPATSVFPTPVSSAAIVKEKQTIDQILSTFHAYPNQSGC